MPATASSGALRRCGSWRLRRERPVLATGIDLPSRLAEQDEDAGADDDRGAKKQRAPRQIAEEVVAEDRAPDDRRIFEGRDRRDLGIAIALGQQDLADAADK